MVNQNYGNFKIFHILSFRKRIVDSFILFICLSQIMDELCSQCLIPAILFVLLLYSYLFDFAHIAIEKAVGAISSQYDNSLL